MAEFVDRDRLHNLIYTYSHADISHKLKAMNGKTHLKLEGWRVGDSVSRKRFIQLIFHKISGKGQRVTEKVGKLLQIWITDSLHPYNLKNISIKNKEIRKQGFA